MVEVASADIPMPSLIDLCHYRWAIPVVAELGRSGGAKFVTLSNRLAVAPESLSRTLTALIDLDYALRNPGYGHPMRPEYLLTPFGEAIAPPAARLLDRLHAAGPAAEAACARKWSLPLLLALRLGASRFSELRDALPGVTPRALTQSLQELETAGLARRVVWDLRPPRVDYTLTDEGRRIAPQVEALARAIAA
ncbi:MAG: winged helix-turn-helix transcriptional regulator [Planctomycetota bacterium]|nr:winged helix-turn-helix transcriptional regulator [Planctomycetota bacterium]